jgi:hypothetical protein
MVMTHIDLTPAERGEEAPAATVRPAGFPCANPQLEQKGGV